MSYMTPMPLYLSGAAPSWPVSFFSPSFFSPSFFSPSLPCSPLAAPSLPASFFSPSLPCSPLAAPSLPSALPSAPPSALPSAPPSAPPSPGFSPAGTSFLALLDPPSIFIAANAPPPTTTRPMTANIMIFFFLPAAASCSGDAGSLPFLSSFLSSFFDMSGSDAGGSRPLLDGGRYTYSVVLIQEVCQNLRGYIYPLGRNCVNLSYSSDILVYE